MFFSQLVLDRMGPGGTGSEERQTATGASELQDEAISSVGYGFGVFGSSMS